ncbi:glycosyltransferase family 4 protein [Methylotetracoccus oryzae]|uniref:glycosyltransferase family 4 protein n=1 Tax=Methylotetracoccus oryzae TaxID=1919059 RepID=UPI00111A954E|nr:glycosyltransferase family 4 protein [Methylotetracoccus oryzae]
MTKKARLLVIALEPTPYNVDQFNAFQASGVWDVTVIYTRARSYAKDAGHNFQELPRRAFEYQTFEGRFLPSRLGAAAVVAYATFFSAPDAVLVWGYFRAELALGILTCAIRSIKFAVFSDSFRKTRGGLRLRLRQKLGSMMRAGVFKYGHLLLVGSREVGRDAVNLGCPEAKVIVFPYCVSVSRLEAATPREVPEVCLRQLTPLTTIIMFSGRLIERKGLSVLLHALNRVECESDWVLWIEGDGPERASYEKEALELGIREKCSFLGFCQMDVHGWLLGQCDILVVPSIEDNWAIAVDEGMQLAKAVISTTATGAARDRIVNGLNGLCVPDGDIAALEGALGQLIDNVEERARLGHAARQTAVFWTPERNAEVFTRALKSNEP